MPDNDASRNRPQAQINDEVVDPDHFNAHVTDDLAAVVRGFGCFVRLELAGYAEALDACLAYAWRRGAWGFSGEHLSDLQDWIFAELDRAIGPEGL